LPAKVFCTSAGVVYTADQYGVIVNVGTPADVADLVAMGCAVLSPPPNDLLFTLTSANMNSTADQQFTPRFTSSRYRIKRYVAFGASTSLTTAAGGIYAAASKAGTAQVAAAQAYSTLTTALKALELTLNNASAILAADTPLFLSLTTPTGRCGAGRHLCLWGSL
jgi:hypothetical protein